MGLIFPLFSCRYHFVLHITANKYVGECLVCTAQFVLDENLHEVVLNGIDKNRIWLMLMRGGSAVGAAMRDCFFSGFKN